MSELPAKGTPQFGKHTVELIRVIDADGLTRKQTNAFLERGGGHGPITMPQFAALFDTVHTVDDPRKTPERMSTGSRLSRRSEAPQRPCAVRTKRRAPQKYGKIAGGI
jgi:hypothetical protein